MLTLHYTENSLHIEQVGIPLTELIARRVELAVSLGQSLYVEPSQGNIPVSADLSSLVEELENILQTQPDLDISISTADQELLEIKIPGTWIANNTDSDEGVLITALTEYIEELIYQMWQSTPSQVFLI